MPNPEPIVRQYRAAHQAGGLYSRSDRGLIAVTGKDRAAWFNNLVTNVVKTLQPGEGNYAFATDLKGRVVFDVNMLVLEDRLWLDVDARQVPSGLSHLDRYIITEDVKLEDVSAAVRRLAALGPRTGDLVRGLGGNLVPMAPLQHVGADLAGADLRIVRHDFAGLNGAEFIASGDAGGQTVQSITAVAAELGLAALDRQTVEILRIEAGIPQSVDDIDADVVPPETLQVERGINYAKGCYLGQEVIERMRSHGILARKLVGLRIEGDACVPKNSPIKAGGQDVGRVTSSCWSEALQAILALGYVKSAHARADGSFTVPVSDGERAARLVSLPVSRK